MINPRMFDNMSWRMAEVYGACVDRLLVNIAHYFPYIEAGQEPKGTFDYMVRMLANMGQVNRESVKIIEQSLQGEDEALRGMLMSAIRDVIMDIDPTLRKAAEQGLLGRVAQPVLDPSTTQAFQMFYKQSADKLNLVNTVMLESTQHAYQNTLTDVVQRVNAAQGTLNVAAGEVVTGVETWNRAMNQAVAAMAQQGLTGFIDHAGRHWTPEAYVAMDIRTTVSNTARAAVWEQNEEYGNDMYSVSSHNGARPLCYPWQGKVISRSDTVRDVEDLQGNKIHVYAQSETSYGEPAGLFGINCGHYPYPFVPGLSMVRGEPQDPEENEKTYQESQEQRRLERELRTAKRDLAVEKARGAPKEVLREKKDKVDQARGKLDDFCEKTGRNRRSAREGTPINARFPDKGSYTVGDMPQDVRNQMREFYRQQAQPIPTTAPVAQEPILQAASIPIETPEIPQAEEPQVTFRKRGDWTPASTIQEAEEQARRFSGSVSYSGIGLDYANTCNRVLADINATYDVRPLASIQKMNMRTTMFRNSTSEAAYRWVMGDLFINPTYYKNPAVFAAHKAEIDSLTQTVLDGGERLLATATGRKREYLQALLTTRRQCVSQSYDFVEGTFVHECGHMLDDRMFHRALVEAFGGKSIGFNDLLADSRHKYGGGISGYAVADNHEYIAESFTAWWFGEGDRIDPVIRSVFEGMVRK